MTLSSYNYSIRYKQGNLIGNADALSRLPRPVTTDSASEPAELIHLLEHLQQTSVSASAVKQWTARDPILSKVHRYVMSGWPRNVDESLHPYHDRRNELSNLNGSLLWGSRIIVPSKGRQAILDELHETHPGTSKMKALARSYVWWPKMDVDIESKVQKCTVCQEQRSSPAPAPLHPWEWPESPWSRIHLDFVGPFMGQMFLIVVDAHSKWVDAQVMSNITSCKTIGKLKQLFATHGLPKTIVTDNGSSFTSNEFQDFVKRNGIRHVTSAPYHPSSNGLAERAVQLVKKGLKTTSGSSIEDKLARFLLKYRITPHSTTGVAPCELLMGRRLRSRLDTFFPDIQSKVRVAQEKQKQSHDNSKQIRIFQIGDLVYIEDFRLTKSKWLPGVSGENHWPSVISYSVG